MRAPPWSPPRERDSARRARTALVLSVLTALTVMCLDAGTGDASPVDPVRSAAGQVFGPMESGMSAVSSPVVAGIDAVGHVRGMQGENIRLHRRVAELRSRLSTTEAERNRLAQYDALAGVAETGDLRLVPAQVVGIGPAQSFARTVTIDAGTADGVEADMTVVGVGGLVGRVLRADAGSATVLLVVDASSVVGGRLADSMELGFLRGSGDVGGDGELAMDLVDPTVLPAAGDTVVTWGSRGGSPYVAGIPIGRVVDVQASAGDQSVTAAIAPFADMSSLDLVGVVVGVAPVGRRHQLTRVAPSRSPGGSAGRSGRGRR